MRTFGATSVRSSNDHAGRTAGWSANVSQPTLTVFRPEAASAAGTGVIVCPGGAFHFLMVDKEGTEVARWLTARGVTAFVLKYRVVPTPDDDAALVRIAANPHQHLVG